MNYRKHGLICSFHTPTGCCPRQLRPLGNIIRPLGEGQQQVGEGRHLGDALPLLEGDKDSLLATVARDDRRLAGDSPVHDGREGRLGVLELEFLHGGIPL